MSGVNKVILVGNLGQDPDFKEISNGAVCNLTIATSRKYKAKDSDAYEEKTEWHKVSMFNKLAEICNNYLKKGSKVYIEGRLQTRKWEDKDGNSRYTTEIVANEMQMLDSRGSSGNESQPKPKDDDIFPGIPFPPPQPMSQQILDDDIPF